VLSLVSFVLSRDTEGKEFIPFFACVLVKGQTADLQNAKEKARYKQFVTNQQLDQWNSKL